jgi:hypothetical protein
MISAGVIDAQVCKIPVASQFTRGHVIGTLAEHNHAIVLLHKDPAGRLVDNVEAERVDVKACGFADVVDGEDVMVLQNRWHIFSRRGQRAYCCERLTGMRELISSPPPSTSTPRSDVFTPPSLRSHVGLPGGAGNPPPAISHNLFSATLVLTIH